MRVAVVGAGVVGLSVAVALRARGAEVTCYERADAVMSERSAGSSRIFRFAHADASLVRLAKRARAGFATWEERAGASMIGTQECVVSVPDLADWAAAMEDAGTPFDVVDGSSERLRVPAVVPPAVALVDRCGGVIDVDAVRDHLAEEAGGIVVHEPVEAIENGRGRGPASVAAGHGPVPSGASLWSASGRADVDAVVIAAGAGTAALAGQVGIDAPSTLSHHVRFTFPIEDGGDWQCWIDKPADGLSTYQHRTGPGRWSVGGTLDPALIAWEVGKEAATEVSREAVTRYVRERLVAEPTVSESLYCTHVPDLGDGFTVRRSGAVLAIWGENLFKFAPLLGEMLADACLDGSTPSVDALAARLG